MTISYNWLSEYLPEKLEPEKLSKILTSIGLEVESLEKYEELKSMVSEKSDEGKHTAKEVGIQAGDAYNDFSREAGKAYKKTKN